LLAQLNKESIHITDLEVGKPLHTDVFEKLSYALSNGCNRSGRKTALDFAITTESVDFLLVWSEIRRLRLEDVNWDQKTLTMVASK